MKKVGIITYHRSHNYGALLQAYSLLTFLRKKKLNVEIIDYWPLYRKGIYDLLYLNFKEKSILFNIKTIIAFVVVFSRKYTRYRRFNKFIHNELGVVKKKPILNGIEISDNYDSLFFGSDQIWRFNEFSSFTGLDPVYWGAYPLNANIKKISYAASMGKMNTKQLNNKKVGELLLNFSSISVREKQLLDYVKNLTSKKVTHVLDPVFLLSKSEWDELAQKRGFKTDFKKKYLLLYNLNMSEETYYIAKEIAKERDLEIFELSGFVRPFKLGKRHKDKFGPMEFINAIKNAEFVISTSFHGVAFSILFEKNFLSLGMKNNSDRVTSLLASLDLENHYFEKGKEFLLGQIDYNSVNLKLETLKKESLNFLEVNISSILES